MSAAEYYTSMAAKLRRQACNHRHYKHFAAAEAHEAQATTLEMKAADMAQATPEVTALPVATMPTIWAGGAL